MEEELKTGRGFFYGVLICFLAGFACTPEKKVEEAVNETVSSAAPSDEQLAEIGIQKLQEWGSYWAAKGADMERFQLEREYVYEPLEWPGENVFAADNPLQKYQLPHPAGEGVVDIYSYKLVLDEEGQGLGFNPDSEVVYYRSDGMRERLLFIGPSGAFEDAVWVTEDHLLVSGHIQKEGGFVPVVWLIQPEQHQYKLYEIGFSTPDYSPDGYLKVKLKDLG